MMLVKKFGKINKMGLNKDEASTERRKREGTMKWVMWNVLALLKSLV